MFYKILQAKCSENPLFMENSIAFHDKYPFLDRLPPIFYYKSRFMEPTDVKITDARRTFLRKGACSHAMFYLLDREFDHLKDQEEKASDLLAGGILQRGYQCGMLWGASLAAGAEAWRRSNNINKAQYLSIRATQSIMASFKEEAPGFNCREITRTDWQSATSIARYFVTGKMFTCFNLMAKWAPKAVESALRGFSNEGYSKDLLISNCATKVALQMGATEEQSIMVAGFAGGLGLSGGGCGALAASLWLKMLREIKKEDSKTDYASPVAKHLVDTFQNETDDQFLCSDITGKQFKTIAEHSEFIDSGGCQKLIDLLSKS
jgi:hypothetical protein